MARNEKRLDDLLSNVSEAFGFSNIVHAEDPVADPDLEEKVETLEAPEEPKNQESENQQSENPKPENRDPEIQAPDRPKPEPRQTRVNVSAIERGLLDPKFIADLPYLVANAIQFGQMDPRLTELAIEIVKDDPAALKQITKIVSERQKTAQRSVVCVYEGLDNGPAKGEEYEDPAQILSSPSVKFLMETIGLSAEDAVSKLFARHLYYVDKDGKPIKTETVTDEDRAAYEEQATKKTRSSSPNNGTDASTTATDGNYSSDEP